MIKKTLWLVASLIIILSLDSCNNNKPWVARDLTAVNTFTKNIEGPACYGSTAIFAVNYQKDSTIGIIDSTGKGEIFAKLPLGSIANAIRFDKESNMYISDYGRHSILVIRSGETKISVFARDSSMNGPNDLAITSRGILFATDSDLKKSTGNVYRINQEGKIVKLDSAMGTTNGIEVSPGDQYLYVNESIQRKIWRYKLDSLGNISDKKLFYTFPDFGLDGMKCDVQGNLYVCRYDKGTVAILSPAGKLVREVELKGKKVANITFGGSSGKTCYVTVQDRACIEKFKTDTPGREWALLH